jgi:hypothetical protein
MHPRLVHLLTQSAELGTTDIRACLEGKVTKMG